MDPLTGNVAQCAIHHALALQAVLAGEGGALDDNGEMRFAAAIIARMAAMLGAVVDHVQIGGRKCCLKQVGDFFMDRSGQNFGSKFSCYWGFSSGPPCTIFKRMRSKNFHGRYDSDGRVCEAPGCEEEGEFRAPGRRGPGFDGPGDWRYFCLDHVREFNDGYDFFENMSAEEILHAQTPMAGWQTETRAFRSDAGVDGIPRWADFADPLDAIGGRANDIRRRAGARTEFSRFTPREREALNVMGLSPQDDRTKLRQRYSELVRRYHPDRNGGDRSHERRLQRTVEAYQLLRKSDSFS